ncbi:MAG: cell division ATP-binding protein FtsE [Candidatus Woykebacteria bacterium RBG_13_40_7b]|uniref:Cell division ATP-binding protein FtsE n=1 Tax=Candidatus Woykebacteria bacterium RBG_13_40_7b TaxID=1802594 RepID=A0A1G1WAA1_9BACT|nr:MAG: cell division ATP-binding protein FtsE [Candidatus Woykebacteria bacterium RBG_13_40_7b]
MIEFEGVSKIYSDSTTALEKIDLKIDDGEFIFVVGPTGAGKTTLLKLLIRQQIPTEGKIFIDSSEITSLPKKAIPSLRRRIGVVFQDFKLLPQKTVYENVSFPLEILGFPPEEIEEATGEILKLISMEDKKDLFPNQISGGEGQKAAIARAFVLKPEIILADEPTGNLDAKSGWEVMKLLSKLNELGSLVIMATHNVDIVSTLPHRMVTIEEGKIIKDQRPKARKAQGV